MNASNRDRRPAVAAVPPSDPVDAGWRANVWIVVPAFDEAERLGRTLDGLCRAYANVVVVDDGSSDATSAVAAGYPVWRLRHVMNCGQGAALQTGIDFAVQRQAEIIVTFDADGQHCVQDIPRLVQPVRDGRAEIALGSRFLGAATNIPWSRWVILKLAVLFTRVFSRVRVTDAHNGLRAFSRGAAERIRITQNGMAHASEILDRIREYGMTFCEVPVTIRYDREGVGKGQSSWNSVRIAGKLVLGRLLR